MKFQCLSCENTNPISVPRVRSGQPFSSNSIIRLSKKLVKFYLGIASLYSESSDSNKEITSDDSCSESPTKVNVTVVSERSNTGLMWARFSTGISVRTKWPRNWASSASTSSVFGIFCILGVFWVPIGYRYKYIYIFSFSFFHSHSRHD